MNAFTQRVVMLPTALHLACLAIAHTGFIAEVEAGPYQDIRIRAEICAQLAAEHWEAEHHVEVGMWLSHELTGQTADLLTRYGKAIAKTAEHAA